MKTPEDHKVLAFVLLPLLLAACGGGGDSADTSPADPNRNLGKPKPDAAAQAAFEKKKLFILLKNLFCTAFRVY